MLCCIFATSAYVFLVVFVGLVALFMVISMATFLNALIIVSLFDTVGTLLFGVFCRICTISDNACLIASMLKAGIGVVIGRSCKVSVFTLLS